MLFSGKRKCCLFILGVSLLLMLQLRFPGNVGAQISRDEAIVIVYTKLVCPRGNGAWVYASNSLVTDTTKIKNWTTCIMSPYNESWFFFIDDHQPANWEHPCRYVFIDHATGADTVFHQTSPPCDISLLELLSDPIGYLELSYQVVTSLPSPGPNPQDLAWDGQYLWIADDSTDIIYKLDPLNGSIISSFPSPGPEPRGLTFDGTYLWCSDSDSVRIFKLDPSNGLVISAITAPVSGLPCVPPEEVRGLAWDGAYLWSAYAAGPLSKVCQVNPTDGSIVDYFAGYSNGIVFDDAYLWNVISWYGYDNGDIEKLPVLSPGEDVYYYKTRGDYPTGLTFDGTCFWLADAGRDTIYQLEIISNTVESSNETLPTSFRLDQNYPNPFNSSTKISYYLYIACFVRLEIYNYSGQKIKTLVYEKQNFGDHYILWNGKDNNDQFVSSGIYFVKMTVETFDVIKKQQVKTKKIMLVK